MKKLLLSICLMCTLMLSATTVFAATIDVSDTEFFRTGFYDNARATLSGKQDELTARITNVQKTKVENGSATAVFGAQERGTTWVKVYVDFYYSGIESNRYLEI